MKKLYCATCFEPLEERFVYCPICGEPTGRGDTKSEYAVNMREAEAFIERGQYERAAMMYGRWLEDSPLNLTCLVGMVRACSENYASFEDGRIASNMKLIEGSVNGTNLALLDSNFLAYAERWKRYTAEAAKSPRTPRREPPKKEEKPRSAEKDKRYTLDGTTLIRYNGNEQTVTLPSFITEIGRNAFDGVRSLEGLIIPDSVKSIGDQAFNECTHLASVTMPKNLNRLGEYAFNGCTALGEIGIRGSITEIPRGCFKDCIALRAVSIPNGVVRVGTAAFSSCGALQEIELPQGLRSLGSRVFENCRALKEIRLPAGVAVGLWAIPEWTVVTPIMNYK